MTTRTRFLLAGLAVSTITLLAACGGDGSSPDRQGADSSDEDTPNARATGAPAAPDIISRSRGGGSRLLSVQSETLPLPSVPGITVRLIHRETLPAEEAFAVAFFVPRSSSGPFPRLATEDEARLRAAITAIGFKDEDITVATSPQFGPQISIRVRVSMASVAADSKRVFAAITESIGTPEQTGAQFSLRDCASGLNAVRQSALATARDRANSIAGAGQLSPGAIVAVLETQGINPYGPPADDPCDPAASFPFKGYGSLLPVDSPPEVEVALDVAVTFALGNPVSTESSRGISAIGSSSVTARADEAYVVVLVESFSGPTGPRPLADRDRQGVIDALKLIGVTEEDIEFFTPPYGGPMLVSVETDDLSNLAKFGDDVSDAVEDLLGRSINQGVVFSHSNCEGAKAEARKEAMADARSAAESLAAASGVKLSNSIRLVAEVTGQSPYGPPPIDPCEEDLTALAQNGYGSADIKPFSAPPEFSVRVTLSVLYGID